MLSHYSKYSGLKLSFFKSEISRIESLKGVELAICDIKCVKLKINTIKTLGIHFSYNNKLSMEKKCLNRNIKDSNRSQNMSHEKFNFRR